MEMRPRTYGHFTPHPRARTTGPGEAARQKTRGSRVAARLPVAKAEDAGHALAWQVPHPTTPATGVPQRAAFLWAIGPSTCRRGKASRVRLGGKRTSPSTVMLALLDRSGRAGIRQGASRNASKEPVGTNLYSGAGHLMHIRSHGSGRRAGDHTRGA
jgi:hypothetical protein